MSKFFKFFAVALLVVVTGFAFTSCSDDDDDKNTNGTGSLVGTWSMTQTIENSSSINTISMVLVFKGDHTGSIKQTLTSQSRAASSLEMNFNWSTVSDSNGNQILQVSYVNGDKNTELFYDDSKEQSIVLWRNQYVLTGKILNIYEGGGVWVFNKK